METLQTFIGAGANLDARTDTGRTALMLAARFQKNLDVMDTLLEAGADVMLRDDHNQSIIEHLSQRQPLRAWGLYEDIPSVHVELEALDSPQSVTAQTLLEATSIIQQRLYALGLVAPAVQVKGSRRITAEFGAYDPGQTIDTMGRTARLEVKDPFGNTILTDVDLLDASLGTDRYGRPAVDIQFDKEGAEKWAQLTTQFSGQTFQVSLDGDNLSEITINDPILDGSSKITGHFTHEEARHLVVLLQEGSLPVAMDIMEIRTGEVGYVRTVSPAFDKPAGLGEPRQETIHNANGVAFRMRQAPAATFPTGIDDSDMSAVGLPFWIAETPVTYELWYKVKDWALHNGYSFANAGREGGHGHTGDPPTSTREEPVTMVSWRDAMVWTNALSEMLNYDPVYTHQGRVIKDSTDANTCDLAIQENANGFRLPTSNEWELAARYRGNDSSDRALFKGGIYWTPGSHASGATANINDAAATQQVAWHEGSSAVSTQDVGLMGANHLGLYDMSGNVWEWCSTQSEPHRVLRGGSWFGRVSFLQIGREDSALPGLALNFLGFRLARAYGDDMTVPTELRAENDHAWLSVSQGQLTFDLEGDDNEDSPFFSRSIHLPPGKSGVTIGRGYDMGQRTRQEVLGDLTAAGVPREQAEKLAEAADLSGNDVQVFYNANRNEPWATITREQQWALFENTYPQYVRQTRQAIDQARSWGIRFPDGTVKMQPAVRRFDDLPPAVQAVAVDMLYNVGAGEFIGSNWGGIFQMETFSEMADYIEGAMEGEIVNADGSAKGWRADTVLAEWRQLVPHRAQVIVAELRNVDPDRRRVTVTESEIDSALQWARGFLGSDDTRYNEWCLRFVQDAYEEGANVPLKRYSYAALASERMEAAANVDRPIPRGALVFYDWWGHIEASPEYRNWGHVGLSLDGEAMVHAYGSVREEDIHGSHVDQRGWTYTGWAWPEVGTRAPEPVSPGERSLPAAVIETRTPALVWKGVESAEYYRVAVSREPYETANLVHFEEAVSTTTWEIPDDVLSVATKYRWNVQAVLRDGTRTPWSDRLYFAVADSVIEESVLDEDAGMARVGEQTSHSADGVGFYMRQAPAATFPTGTDDSGEATVDTPFWIAETQVTYELWWTVRQWALDNGYTFANEGMEGSTIGGGDHPNYNNIGNPPTSKRTEPVTMVSWRDSIVWTNALSEMLGYAPVYTYQGNVIRDSTNETACDNATQENTNGFRLPTSDEWELAARYKGNDSSHGAISRGGLYWTPGSYASGASADYNNATATQAVAWYGALDGSGNTDETQNVGVKRANGLGVYDMSGNVWEWCFDHPSSSGFVRVLRGGSWNVDAYFLQVGLVYGYNPVNFFDYGLRLARIVDDKTQQYTLTVESTGQGTVSPEEGEQEYSSGTAVDLTATPSTDWTFSHWEGPVTDPHAVSTTLFMDGNHVVIAVFQEVPDHGPAGEKTRHQAGYENFNMRLAPAATFPTGVDDDGEATVDTPFWIGETQVTYALWYSVRQWALENGYRFANEGTEGGPRRQDGIGSPPTSRQNEPVTMVNWRDSIVWTNALSEMMDLDPVYTYEGNVIRDATSRIACVNATQENNNGFRLPTSNEWELAARYKGDDSSHGAISRGGLWWTPGYYASGATGPAWEETDEAATQAVAWYDANSEGTTKDVGLLQANGLGVYDMSGNVREWTSTQTGSRQVRQVLRGGDSLFRAELLQVGRVGSSYQDGVARTTGIRLARTVFEKDDSDDKTQQYSLTVETTGQGTVYPEEGEQEYASGTVVHLTATPSTHWTFGHWEGPVADPHAESTTVTMDDDHTVTTVFEEKTVGPGPGDPGEQARHSADGVAFNMRLAPAATFPTGMDDDGEATVDAPFWIAETQVTYELWYTVRQWALENGYAFENAGMEGSTTGGGSYPNFNNIGNPPTSKKNEPVTMVSWRDSIVWTNALSEMLGYDPVYTYQGNVIRDSTNETACDSATQANTNGFRLPISNEWELAARYKGNNSSHGAISRGGLYWTPGNYASGATADYTNATATQEVAWCRENSDVDGSGRKTQDVGLKRANGLGVYDMSGNVWEWCSDRSGSLRVNRGGCYFYSADILLVGLVNSLSPDYVTGSFGLRLARTHF